MSKFQYKDPFKQIEVQSTMQKNLVGQLGKNLNTKKSPRIVLPKVSKEDPVVLKILEQMTNLKG